MLNTIKFFQLLKRGGLTMELIVSVFLLPILLDIKSVDLKSLSDPHPAVFSFRWSSLHITNS